MKIVKSEGINESENRLSKIGNKVFLDLWSYPNVYYKDKTPKEFADLLVVCGSNILIFSDKQIKFNTEIDVAKAWKRWENKAIISSIKQLLKAEKRLKSHSGRLFLDAKYSQPFPINIPNIENMSVHLICIANGAQEACKKFYGHGCSGSLRFISEDLSGQETEYLNLKTEEQTFFRTKDYEKDKKFIHIFDDFSFPFILSKLDTIADFVEYLTKKENFLRCGALISYTGEEDFLLNYLSNNRSFPYKKGVSGYSFFEEDWSAFESKPEYIRKIQEDKKSYIWDRFIKTCAGYKLNGEGETKTPKGKENHEGALRYMALENRLGRRFISERLDNAFNSYFDSCRSEEDIPIYLTLFPSFTTKNLWYLILQLQYDGKNFYENYRKNRAELLALCCQCAKSKSVIEGYELDKIVGMALEPPKISVSGSEDLVLVEFNNWSEKHQEDAEFTRNKLNIFNTPLDAAPRAHIQEYPSDNKIKLKRNEPCPCGSGKKYKKCCLSGKLMIKLN